MSTSEWVKAGVTVLVAAIAALGTAVGTASRVNSDDVGEDQFVRTAAANCQDINELKGTLRSILLDVGRSGEVPNPNFVAEAVEKLQTTDCAARVGR